MKFLTSNEPAKARYRYFQALYMAFFSRDLYVDVIKRWRGLGMRYLVLMLSILVLPTALQLMLQFKHDLEQNMILPMQQLPSFEIREGEAFFHGNMPYLVKDAKGRVISIIDTEGSIKALPSVRYPDAKILVTRNTIRMLMPEMQPLRGKIEQGESQHIYPLVGEDNMIFSGAEFIKKTHSVFGKYLMTAAFYPMGILLYTAFYTLILFALVFVAQIIARFLFKVPLSFKETARLLVVAATPQAFLYFGLLAFDKVYPDFALVYVALLAVYFSFGVLSCRSSSKAVVVQ